MATQEPIPVIDDPGGLAGGSMIIVSVNAIKERSPKRWPMKQESVWEFAERQFQRDFRTTDTVRRLNDTQYLITQGDETGTAAQYRAVNFLKSIYHFFLGSDLPTQLDVQLVESICDGVASTRALTPEEIRHLGPPEPSPKTPTPPEHPPSQRIVQIHADHRLELLMLTDPIWMINKEVVASYFLRTGVFDRRPHGQAARQCSDLSLRDMLAIDTEVLRNAIKIITEAQAAGATFSLHVPLTFRCLRSMSCRAALARLMPAVAEMRKFIVFYIVGVPNGAPRGVLAEAISVLKRDANGVLILADALSNEPVRWRGLGLSGVSVDLIEEPQNGPEILARLQDFASACEGVGSGLVAHAVASRPVLLAARAAGFTHVSGSIVSDKLPELGSAMRFPVANIYR
jgi:hypothetical protein